MAISKRLNLTKRLNLENIFILLFLALFPLGQIIRIWILQPIDVVVGLAALYTLIKKLPRPPVFKYIENFLFFAAVSWAFSIIFFPQIEVLFGLLYLIRLCAYFYFLIYVWNFIRKKSGNKKLLVNSLLIVSCASAVFGWIQFFWIPDVRALLALGWDEHFLRLVGTFLDPTYLGLIIVFGLVMAMVRFIDTKAKGYLFLIMFLLGTLAFTYSRASYLAFLVGAVFIGISGKKIRIVAFSILSLLLVVLMLPTSANQVLKYTRSFSAIARLENYKTTFTIFSKTPVMGVGYNNLCLAYQKDIGYQPFSSHSCSGSDSSLLFVLATTGVVGFVAFVYMLFMIASYLTPVPETRILVPTFAALMIHSLFSNSIFYSWIMGYMMILLSASLGSEVEG